MKIDSAAPLSSGARRRPKQGAIKDAILDILTATDGPLTTLAILECLAGTSGLH